VCHRHTEHSSRGAHGWRCTAAALALDCAAHAEGLDRAAGVPGTQAGGFLARPSSPPGRGQERSGTTSRAEGLDAFEAPGGTVRPKRKNRSELKALAPQGQRRMGSNPHANGGLIRKALRMPDFRSFAIQVAKPGTKQAENTRPLGMYLRDV